ncbi:hypothetical protein HN827_05555 [archaeon]|jgi:hypothetical protein|nr:hypothetical protein [archaeon]MBT4646690.1 hypothetical protein [archaeon]MBT6821860.1 hypothetical protein [archaeon]MBT7392270.1 hypothetical protein [archaeon]
MKIKIILLLALCITIISSCGTEFPKTEPGKKCTIFSIVNVECRGLIAYGPLSDYNLEEKCGGTNDFPVYCNTNCICGLYPNGKEEDLTQSNVEINNPNELNTNIDEQAGIPGVGEV